MTVIAEFLFALGFGAVDTAPLDDATRKADRAGSAIDKKWSDVAKTVGKAGLAVATATAGAAVGLFKLTQSAASAGDEIAKTSKGLGIASDDLQRLRFAAERSGGTARGMTRALRAMTVGLQDAATKGTGPVAEGLEAIGLEVEDLMGLGAEQQFGVLSDALEGVANEATRSGIAMKLFGSRGGVALKPLLDEGSAGIRKLGDEAERLGLVMDRDALAASESFSDSLLDLRGTLGAVARNIGVEAIPAMKDAADGIREWTVENRELIDQDLPLVFSTIADGLGTVASATAGVVEVFASAQRAVTGFFDELLDAQLRQQLRALGVSDEGAAAAQTTTALHGQAGLARDTAGRRAARAELEREAVQRRWEQLEEAARTSAPAPDQGPSLSLAPIRVRRQQNRLAGRKSAGRKGGGRSRSDGAVEFDAVDFEALDLFGEELQRLAAEGGVGEVAVDAAVKAAAGSLRSGAHESVARKAALSRLGSLAGQDFASIPKQDPLLSQIFGEDVPDIELSSLARGAQPQTLVSTITNTFHIKNSQEIRSTASPTEVAREAVGRLRDAFEGSVAASTKSAQVNFAR